MSEWDWKEAAREDINGFRDLSSGWDGYGGVPPNPACLELALVIVDQWPTELGEPEADVCHNGHVHLTVYDAAGLSQGGVQIMNEQHGIFTVMDIDRCLGSGTFNPSSPQSVADTLSFMVDQNKRRRYS